MVDDAILTAIERRLAALFAPPAVRYVPLRVDGHAVGHLDPARAGRLARFTDVLVVGSGDLAFAHGVADFASRTAALERVARTLEAEGALTRWRDERYAVAPSFGAPPLFLLERAAARYFGILTYAAHVNGITTRDGGDAMWIARRSAAKPIDPGMLDNLVGGGIRAGCSVLDTVVREAFEEAGVPAALASTAMRAGEIRICRTQPDGLQNEIVFAHDLALPPDFVPCNQDGEVAEWRLAGESELARILASTGPPDEMTADASLVALDWLARRGRIAPEHPAATLVQDLRRRDCPSSRR